MSSHDEVKIAKAKKALGIPADEPIFVLRGQDALAPGGVRNYRNIVRQSIGHAERPQEWWDDLDNCAHEMLRWQNEHPDKVKMPD